MRKLSFTRNRKLEKDVESFLEVYPSFSYDKRHGKKYSILKGETDICDINGNYLDSFKIEIWLDHDSHPFSIPLVKECSKKIERHEDWHVNDIGYCCLDIDHELEYMAKKGIELVGFYQKRIYPFFANTLYKMYFGKYSNGEYGHDFKGVEQFYSERLLLNEYPLIVRILKAILKNRIPGRNDRPCICGQDKKFKGCHLDRFDFLQRLSRKRLLRDLVGFESLSSGTGKSTPSKMSSILFP